jgi:F-type H+-transporting ATPase subunit b
MLTAVVTRSGDAIQVQLQMPQGFVSAEAAEGEAGKEVDMGPNPISPETKELLWGAGSFLVLLVLMRYFLFPKLKKGMDARYAGIRSEFESADTIKADARKDVVAYEQALASIRAEAAARVDAARAQLDSERQAKLAEVNAVIAQRRSEADAANAAAREAARGQVSSAVATVASKAAELATGRAPDASVVQQAVASAMESAGSR